MQCNNENKSATYYIYSNTIVHSDEFMRKSWNTAKRTEHPCHRKQRQHKFHSRCTVRSRSHWPLQRSQDKDFWPIHYWVYCGICQWQIYRIHWICCRRNQHKHRDSRHSCRDWHHKVHCCTADNRHKGMHKSQRITQPLHKP